MVSLLRFALLSIAVSVSGCTLGSREEGTQEFRDLRAEYRDVADDEGYDASWHATRLALRLVEHPGTPSGKRVDWAETALADADRAVALGPDRIEGHYYRAVALGRVLGHRTLPPISKIADLEAEGQRALEIDPAFNCAGPCRLLAMLYWRAPSWPIGPDKAQDEEEIERLFQEAIRHAPRCPENLFAYGEFLFSINKNDKSAEMTEAARMNLPGHEGLEPHERAELKQKIDLLLEALGK